MVHCGPVEPVEKAICADEQAQAQMARLLIIGLVCPNCAARVRNALLRLEGVVSADVDWTSGLAFIDFVPGAIDPHSMMRAVYKAGAEAGDCFRAAVIPRKEV